MTSDLEQMCMDAVSSGLLRVLFYTLREEESRTRVKQTNKRSLDEEVRGGQERQIPKLGPNSDLSNALLLLEVFQRAAKGSKS